MRIKFLSLKGGYLHPIFKKNFFIYLFIFLISSVEAYAVIQVKDFRGKTIKLDKPVQKVVCLIESALTGIYMLKKGEKIIGVPSNVYDEGFYYNETFKYYSVLDERIKLREVPALGNWESVNLERIISLRPDLVIIWANQKDAIENIERFGIPVYAVFITKINDVFKQIEDFGLLFDAKNRAYELVKFVKNEIDQLKKISDKIVYKKRVFFSWAQHNFLQTSCKGSIIDELIENIGGLNICGEIFKESELLTIEKLILLNPDVIIMWNSKSLKPQNILSNKQYRTIKAIRDGKVFQFRDTFNYDLWTLKFLYAMKFMAKVIYPNDYNYELEEEKKRIINYLYDKKLL